MNLSSPTNAASAHKLRGYTGRGDAVVPLLSRTPGNLTSSSSALMISPPLYAGNVPFSVSYSSSTAAGGAPPPTPSAFASAICAAFPSSFAPRVEAAALSSEVVAKEALIADLRQVRYRECVCMRLLKACLHPARSH